MSSDVYFRAFGRKWRTTEKWAMRLTNAARLAVFSKDVEAFKTAWRNAWLSGDLWEQV